MGIICQLNFTISTISKADGRWDWADFSKSWTLPTMEADIVTCLPRLTVEFPQLIENFQFNERTIRLLFKLLILSLYFLV